MNEAWLLLLFFFAGFTLGSLAVTEVYNQCLKKMLKQTQDLEKLLEDKKLSP